MKMRRVTKVLGALAILAGICVGCAGVKEEAKIRCPKCGTLFRVETSAPTSHPVRY